VLAKQKYNALLKLHKAQRHRLFSGIFPQKQRLA